MRGEAGSARRLVARRKNRRREHSMRFLPGAADRLLQLSAPRYPWQDVTRTLTRRRTGGVMSHHWLLGFVAIGITAAALVSAPAQPIDRAQNAATVVHEANALTARIRAYHRGPGSWRTAGPPPPGYCATMSAGEFVLKELVLLANAA